MLQPEVQSLLDGKDDFTLYIPDCVEFSLAKAGEVDPEKERRIKGYCSTESRDRQDEILVQKGLDFNEFVKHGWFNDNHKQGITDVLGYPELAKHVANKGWWTEGYLLKEFRKAEEVWELAKALAKTHRRLGFSVEGKVLMRGHDNRVLKARIRNVAITHVPVNTDCTWDIISKAFGSAEEVEQADNGYKALAAGTANPAVGGGRALAADDEESSSPIVRKSGSLSFDEAVIRVKHTNPDWSYAICERFVNYVINKENAHGTSSSR